MHISFSVILESLALFLVIPESLAISGTQSNYAGSRIFPVGNSGMTEGRLERSGTEEKTNTPAMKHAAN